MPIENERKFVLRDDGDLEPRLASGRRDQKLLRQAYLDVSGMRIRSVEEGGAIRHVFTTSGVDGQIVEIETEISPVDFERLWSQRRETCRSCAIPGRRSLPWDVDFFKTRDTHLFHAGRSGDAEEQTERHRCLEPRGPPAGRRAGRRSAFASKRWPTRLMPRSC